jgi:PKD repeat protein
MKPLLFAAFVGGLLLRSASAATWYVATNGNDSAGGTNWSTAKATIQAAIDVSANGDTVLVNDGIYESGGRVVYGALTNRVALTNAITVQSVNGPDVTAINGSGPPGATAVRCAFVGHNAVLSGFTLAQGSTLSDSDVDAETCGGGAWCETNGAVVNCVIAGNSAFRFGGGAAHGLLSGCTISGNSAANGGGTYTSVLHNCRLVGNAATASLGSGGGSHSDILYDCLLAGNSAFRGGGASQGQLFSCVLSSNSAYHGGGAAYGTLSDCTVYGNTAGSYGGGAYFSSLRRCVLAGNTGLLGGGSYASSNCNSFITGNFASSRGGGAYQGWLLNCTVVSNSAGNQVGGVDNAVVHNSIVYFNTAPVEPNQASTMSSSCSTPLPAGSGNIADNPQFIALTATNAQLSPASPCLNAGNNAWACSETDVDGTPRILSGVVDMGAYEGSALYAPFVAPATVVVGHPAPFHAQFKHEPLAFYWSFGDGQVVTNENPVLHAFSAGGDYAVVLAVSNSSGGSFFTVRVSVVAAQWHVAPSGNDAHPGTNWTTAKATIQAGVDAAAFGGTVLVSNGLYASGARFGAGVSNRVIVSNEISVISVNGYEETSILGAGPQGSAAVRCVYLEPRTVLSGFTLDQGATATTSGLGGQGGGVCCTDVSASVINCRITGNAALQGGGSHGGTLRNCLLLGNRAWFAGGGSRDGLLINCVVAGNAAESGGGVAGGTHRNCSLTGNLATYGGGAYDSALYNSLVFYNTAPIDPNHRASVLTYCCTTPLPLAGNGNFTNEPRVASVAWPTPTETSPCIDAGDNSAAFGPVDLAGNARTNGIAVEVGAFEYDASAAAGSLTAQILWPGTRLAVGYAASFQALVSGSPRTLLWSWDDGAEITNSTILQHAFETPGIYRVILTAANGVQVTAATALVTVVAQDLYVAPSGDDLAPGTNWATAKATILGALDVAPAGGTVFVSNGVYAAGYRTAAGGRFRVAISNGLSVVGVNGPDVTHLYGESLLSSNAMRTVSVGAGASISGFLLASGSASRVSGDSGNGGGLYCEDASARVSNCVVSGNAALNGGGSFGGTLRNCTLVGNLAISNGGGAFMSTLYDCTVTGNAASNAGGGSALGMMMDCVLCSNSAVYGGGAYSNELQTCLLTGNVAPVGGGACGGVMSNCQFMNNHAGGTGGGAYAALLDQCILSGNSATAGGGAYTSALTRCEVTGNQAGQGAGCYASTVRDSVLAGNVSSGIGGGAVLSTLYGCLVSNNTVTAPAGTGVGYGGGTVSCVIYGSRIVNNYASAGGGCSGGTLYDSLVGENRAWFASGGVSGASLYNCRVLNNHCDQGLSMGGGASGCSLYNCLVAGNRSAWYAAARTRATSTTARSSAMRPADRAAVSMPPATSSTASSTTTWARETGRTTGRPMAPSS